MKEEFKFNIEEPISRETISEIKNIDIASLKVMSKSFIFLSFLTLVFFYLNKEISNNIEPYFNNSLIMYIVLVALIAFCSFCVGLIYRTLKIKSTISPVYFNLEYIPKSYCKEVSEWMNKYDEVNSYMVKLNNQCRMLTCYEYYNLLEFVNLKEKEIEKKEAEKYCRKIYQQDYLV